MHSEVKRLSEVPDRLGAIWGLFPIIQLCHDIGYGHSLLELMQSREFRNKKESFHPLKPAFLSLVPDGILLSPEDCCTVQSQLLASELTTSVVGCYRFYYRFADCALCALCVCAHTVCKNSPLPPFYWGEHS